MNKDAILGQGVTYIHGEGGYTGASKKIIFCVINSAEEEKLHVIAESIDPDVFIAIGSINNVHGGHFEN